jgi:hypothetical protein
VFRRGPTSPPENIEHGARKMLIGLPVSGIAADSCERAIS